MVLSLALFGFLFEQRLLSTVEQLNSAAALLATALLLPPSPANGGEKAEEVGKEDATSPLRSKIMALWW